MLQILYASSANPKAGRIDLDALLAQARDNNARDAITGLLYTDGRRFLQVLEGPEAAVEDVVRRLGDDPRHRAIVLLSRRTIERREFGCWSMARALPDERYETFGERIAELCRAADPAILGSFQGLIQMRMAA